jgi:hypothetical protein
MMEMGYGMGGLEDRIVITAHDVGETFREITYIEIGVGEGATMTAIASTLRDTGKKWRVIGIELVNGYSFNREKTIAWAKERNLKINFVTPNGSTVYPEWNAVTVYFKDSQSFLTEHWQEPIHFAMIDGCHGKPCVIADFLALEAFMVPRGTLMFHDYGDDQKGHFQPHCPSGLDVRGAVAALGLINGSRRGWTFESEWTANKLTGGWDMGIFSKNG